MPASPSNCSVMSCCVVSKCTGCGESAGAKIQAPSLCRFFAGAWLGGGGRSAPAVIGVWRAMGHGPWAQKLAWES